MSSFDVKTIAERLIESVENQGLCRIVEHAITPGGVSVKVTNNSAFAGFFVNGSRSSKILHRELVGSLGMIGGLNLPDSERCR